MTKSSKTSKKPVLGPFLVHYPHFWGKNIFLKKYGPVLHKTWAPNTMLSFRKTNKPIPRKLPDGSMKGWTDHNYRTLLATAGCPIQSFMSHFPPILFSHQSLFPKIYFLLVIFPSLNFKLNIDTKTKKNLHTFYLPYILLIKREKQQHSLCQRFKLLRRVLKKSKKNLPQVLKKAGTCHFEKLDLT